MDCKMARRALITSLLVACAWRGRLVAVETEDDTPPAVRFQLAPARVNDRMTQTLQFRLEMSTSEFQGERPVNSRTTQFTRRQKRSVTAREVKEGRVTSAEVGFDEANLVFQESDALPQRIVQPVVGKSYIVAREDVAADGANDGADIGRLTVIDANGRIPPMEEFEIVLQSMDSIGRPNPLAQFLNERAFTVGTPVSLPKEIGQSLLGGAENATEIQRFELTLRRVESIQGRPTAVFAVRIDARSPAEQQMGMLVEGEMHVETETCRMIAANLNGPIAMTATRGGIDGQTVVTGKGTISVAIASQYVTK